MQMKVFLLLIAISFASKQSNNVAESDGTNGASVNGGEKDPILVKIEEDEYSKKNENSSQFIGVSYNVTRSKWQAKRYSKHGKKNLYNGYYADEETAAHASDTLARQLLTSGEQNHKLNFPDDETEVFPEEKMTSSQYIGVSYDVKNKNWRAGRKSKHEKKTLYNGCYRDEVISAHASDTLARKLLAKGEQNHKLNFPDDETEVFPEERTFSSQYIGVTYDVKSSKWQVKRNSKLEKKILYNGYYRDEETAAHASDTLARKLMANGENNHKLNFPYDTTEVFPEKKMTSSQYIGVNYDVKSSKWRAGRKSKHEKKILYNGFYANEEIAAHASDTLARKLLAKGEQNHKLNFPDDTPEVFPEERQRKRKRPHPKNN